LYISYLEKPYYSINDRDLLIDIKALIGSSFPPLGEITTKKKLLSSNEKEIWKCVCGRSNDIHEEHCSNCQNDIYGFKSNQVKPNKMVNLIEDRLTFINQLI